MVALSTVITSFGVILFMSSLAKILLLVFLFHPSPYAKDHDKDPKGCDNIFFMSGSLFSATRIICANNFLSALSTISLDDPTL